jgi:two-component system sensor histidine kinase HydH
MNSRETAEQDAARVIVARAIRRFRAFQTEVHAETDRIFLKLLLAEWAFALALSVWLSPYAWQGSQRTLNAHVWVALGVGGLLCSLPAFLITTQPGKPLTRHTVAIAQMLMSALLIHLTGGRIETHFHVFGSLAFVAFYLDWRVLLTATLTVALEHLLRGMLWPESIYGLTNPEWWRFLEHSGWVLFCAAFLVRHCVVTLRSWLRFAEEGGMLEALAESEWRERSVLEREHQGAVPGAAE